MSARRKSGKERRHNQIVEYDPRMSARWAKARRARMTKIAPGWPKEATRRLSEITRGFMRMTRWHRG